MAVDYNIVAEKIFRILKGRGYSVQLFDAEDGNEIVDPQTARFFYIQEPNLMQDQETFQHYILKTVKVKDLNILSFT